MATSRRRRTPFEAGMRSMSAEFLVGVQMGPRASARRRRVLALSPSRQNRQNAKWAMLEEILMILTNLIIARVWPRLAHCDSRGITKWRTSSARLVRLLGVGLARRV